jgi:hypothetical protein
LNNVINKLFVILFVISFLIIIATIFCFRQPEQAIAQVTTTHSAQSMVMNKSTTIQQQYNIIAPISNDSNFLKIKFLANDISNRINTIASILENTSKLSAVINIPYANSINKTLHGIPDNLDIAKRKIAQQIILQHSNSSFVSISFLLSNGDIYMVEPYDRQLKLPINNLAHRDYFIGAVTTHKPYLSQVFTTPVDGSNVATISVPIYSKENNSNSNASLIGTWNGNININSVFQQAINDELTKSPKNKNVSNNNNEHIFLVDDAGNIAAQYRQYNSKFFTDFQSFKDAISGKYSSKVETENNIKTMIFYYPFKFYSTTWAVLLIKSMS